MNSTHSAQAQAEETTPEMPISPEKSAVPVPMPSSGQLPRLAAASSIADGDAILSSLRRFHLTGEAGELAEVPKGNLPALLAPYRNIARVRFDYPLFLCPVAGSEELHCRPLAGELVKWVESFAPEESQALILRNNLARIERLIRRRLAEESNCANAAELVAAVGKAVVSELDLGAEPTAVLEADIDKLVAAIPDTGQIVGFRGDAALYLLLAAAWAAVPARRAAFLTRTVKLLQELRDLLRIERGKSPDSVDAGSMQRSLGQTGSLDPAVLAATIGPYRGSVMTSPERIARLESAVETLEKYAAEAESQPLLTIVHSGDLSEALVRDPSIEAVRVDHPCDTAAAEFERAAEEMAQVFRAVRTARLELDGNYEPSHHDPWLAGLTWEAFSLEELRLVRPVVALTPTGGLSDADILSLSRLLRSAQPVAVVVTDNPAGDAGTEGAGSQLGSGVRFEVGYFAISHREALVHSSTVSRPEHLVRGYRTALGSTRPALHLVASTTTLSGDEPALGGWLQNGAAIEGRAHPLYLYDPEPGLTWARRFDFDGNPQAESDWPAATLHYRDWDGEQSREVAFTFADFALLEPAYAMHYRVVPSDCPTDDLVAVDEYLTLDEDDAARKVPYVWAVDADNKLTRLAITRRLAFACRDRLSYWRTLQELSGVRNEYVQQAVARARREAEAEAETRIAELTAQHSAEVDRVRNDAAGEAMHKLAAALLETDVNALAAVAAPPTGAPTARAPAPAPAAEQAPAEAASQPQPVAEDDMGMNEAWIDTPLCTSCNDCLGINPQLFTYDENKQASIGDLSTGTYEQLVRAAEKCPARCIHPGKPTNPNEPNLEELIKRAEPFN